ncbi:MAG: ribbon-helix-helix domain-containing protein [Steroidobacteraceae bacterium]
MEKTAIIANLDAEQLERLNELSAQTRIPRAALIREAVDDLLEKRRIEWTRERASNPPRNIHRARLVKSAKPK